MRKMSHTAKSAVSDYEHLKYRFGDENQHQLNTSDDEDFLPLKSRIKKVYGQQDALLGLSSIHQQDAPVASKYVVNGLDSIERVPVPSAWSPGMTITPNPSLFVTPEKPSKIAEKDNILEPRDFNKVPTPVAWSPHHQVKPSVFITPEKPADGDSTSLKGVSTTHKSAIQMVETTKTKDKLTVRFDLPSSSGEECMDSSVVSDSYSPITIRGKNINKGSEGSGDLLCSSKVYNPMVYSDESILDDSLPTCKEIESDAVSLSTSANLVEKLNQLLISSKGHTGQNIPSQSELSANQNSNNSIKDSMNNLKSLTSSKAPVLSQRSSIKSVPNNSSIHSKKSSTTVPANKSSKKIPASQPTKEPKSGPHHLSSSVSPYYPPNSGAFVVREAKHPMVSTDYSYPFQNSDDNQEHEHIFSRPEYNSTLKVRSELDSLCDHDVDVQKAVEVKLSKSNTKRTEIQEKAAVFTNHMSDQFTNLVDLEPAVDRLCDRVVRLRTCKAMNQKKGHKQPKKRSAFKEPDLMEFYHSDLQKESPDLCLLGIRPVVPDLIGAPHDQAFDCYRHNRAWNGLRDF